MFHFYGKIFELFFVWMFYIIAIIVPKSIYVWMKYKNNPLLHSKGLQTNTHYEQGFVCMKRFVA